MTARGGWCAPRPTSRNWSWWWKARSRKRACARPSMRWTRCCAKTRKSAPTTRRSDDTRGPLGAGDAVAGNLLDVADRPRRRLVEVDDVFDRVADHRFVLILGIRQDVGGVLRPE